MQQGLLARDERHGSLRLTSQGEAVLGGQAVRISPLEADTSITPTPSRKTVVYDYDADLFTVLREKRHELAVAAGLPAFFIFQDRSLQEMATVYPQTETAFANIYGVGQARLKKYAGEFLPIIHDVCVEKGIPLAPESPLKRNKLKSRTIEVTHAYNSGESVEELAERMGVTQRTILDHLWRYAQAGRMIRPEGIQGLSTLSPDQQVAALDCFTTLGIDFLRPVFDALEGDVSYDELRLLRLLYVARQTN